jgi:hypothetical protein
MSRNTKYHLTLTLSSRRGKSFNANKTMEFNKNTPFTLKYFIPLPGERIKVRGKLL